MFIRIECPSCLKKCKAKEELAGKRVKCPSCGKAVPVPAKEESTMASAVATKGCDMFTVRLADDVLPPEVKARFLELLEQRGMRAREKRFCENLGENGTRFTRIVDWNEPVHLATRLDAERLARDLRDAAAGSEWQVLPVRKAEVEANEPIAVASR